jgi:hypothetical protein
MAVEKQHTAMTAPLWTMGPSLPTAKPPSTDSVTPTALQASVLMRTSRGTLKQPLSTHYFHGFSQCCGSRMSIPDPGSASKNLSILTQKIVSQLPEIKFGLFIPDPDPDFLPIPDPGSRGQKGNGSRIRNTEFCLDNITLDATTVPTELYLTLGSI